MDVIIFSIFLFFSLISIGYAFYNKKVIYFAAISSFFLVLLGIVILTEGLTQSFGGSYGFVNATNNSETGMSAITMTILENTNLFAQASGIFLVLLAIMTLFLSFWYMLKGSSEEDED